MEARASERIVLLARAMRHPWSRLRRYSVRSQRGSAIALLGSVLVSACLERPVAQPIPHTTNLFIDDVPTRRVNKIDLLFVIDNSQSMADKQQMLKLAVPGFLERLVNPSCVSVAEPSLQKPAAPRAPFCEPGFQREFEPIEDIHVGIISSSLGGPKGTLCAQEAFNDHAHLIPTVRPNVASYAGLGFWAWDPKARSAPPGEADLSRLVSDFSQGVASVGETGCGFEAPLEAWYRFLIDPEPYQTLEVQAGKIVKLGIDEELLAQRKAFLRPDSLVAIVMLTDENDCSALDEGLGWLVGAQSFQLEGANVSKIPRGTTACASDPDSVCCRSCGLPAETPANCVPVAKDPACQAEQKDPPNLRCFDQKRRFGLAFLQPTSRYVDALKSPTVLNRAGASVKNPLFAQVTARGEPRRARDVVFLAGIVGVPWQDLATDESLNQPDELSYLSAAELRDKGLWSNLVGDRESGARARDPLLTESIEPRSGTHPRTGEALVSADSLNPQANSINGHEYHSDGTDLQYACVFNLPEKQRDCSVAQGAACDCGQAPSNERSSAAILSTVQGENRSLCQPEGGGPAQTTQFQAKAYPGGRLLEVLKGSGDSGVVASICPKVTSGQATLPNYGYNPALSAIVERFGEKLRGQCLPRKLTLDPAGHLPCRVVEASSDPAPTGCQCGPGRHVLNVGANAQNRNLSNLVIARLKKKEACGVLGAPSCESVCLCEVEETRDPRCLSETSQPEGLSGYCYVDPEKHLGSPALVAQCPANQRQVLRFVGEDLPKAESNLFYACAGDVAGHDDQ